MKIITHLSGQCVLSVGLTSYARVSVLILHDRVPLNQEYLIINQRLPIFVILCYDNSNTSNSSNY